MKGYKVLVNFAVASLLGVSVAISASKASAQQVLQPSQTVSGIISEGTSRLFVFKGGQQLGEEYTFAGQAGDRIRIAVMPETGSSLRYTVVLFGPNGLPNEINSGERELDLTGTWKVRVLSFKKTQGRYQISLVKRIDQGQVLTDFLRDQAKAEEARRQAEARRRAEEAKVLEEEKNLLPPDWGLTRLACGGSGIVEISINAKLACAMPTADLPVGRYVYDQTHGELIPLSVPSAVNVNSSNQGGPDF